jgi:hypothetical protein
MRRLVLGTSLLLGIIACAESAATIRPFADHDYARYRIPYPATASVSGQAFMKTRGGEVRYAAGNVVFLEPSTPHSQDIARALAMRKPSRPEDPRVREFQKSTIADGEGRFRFTALLPGEYLVKTYLVWEYHNRFDVSVTGGWIYNQVTVHDGENAAVVVTTTHL